jgi:hypothetical protein
LAEAKPGVDREMNIRIDRKRRIMRMMLKNMSLKKDKRNLK